MDNYYSSSSSSSQNQPPLPLHLCFFLSILFMFLGLSWYINYEPVVESLVDQVKLYVIVSPLILLLVLHWLSNDESGRFAFLVPFSDRDQTGGSGIPWGVGFFLVLVLFMISYQSYFQERWFPLLAR